MRGYEDVKAMAKRMGCTIPDLLCLARQNDPYFAGAPASKEQGEWFASIWSRFGYGTGVHLRRVHYQVVSVGLTKHNGQPYENTLACWDYLCIAAKSARYLGLVDVDAFVDRRNPAPHVFRYGRYEEARPRATVSLPSWDLPTIDTELADQLSVRVVGPEVEGYDYDPADQAYHIEVWAEKSTMDDVLTPVCRDNGVNLVTSLGFQSITSVIGMLKRIEDSHKPARIFYVSDYDPAGDSMPVAVARQVEYWAQSFTQEEIKLQPLVLTKEQVAAYNLPPVPIKESDSRRAAFETRYDTEGAVELDALEALRPGVLARILQQALRPYMDTRLQRRLTLARTEAAGIATEAWHELTADESEEADRLNAEAMEIVNSYRGRLEELAHEMKRDLFPVEDQIADLFTRVEDLVANFAPELPDRPTAEPNGQDESTWLFDSNRTYVDQLDVYRQRKAGELAIS